jgi:hypothetical protein
MAKIILKIKQFNKTFVNFFSKTYESRKKTFKVIALLIFTTLFLLQAGIILINNSFYTNFSDDILQYYTIMVDFIASVKDGSVSFFNLNNYFGASFFSDIYYIPLDIFTFITFLFSYIMPTEIAYSITELFKIFIGVMAFAYYLNLKNMKNRTIFWMSIFYFVSGGMVSFMAFPVFLSIIFYMPLALIVIHYFFHGKRWIVPLFAFMVVFYDFYLAYMLLAFTSFAFLIEYFKNPDFKFFKFIKEGAIFLFLLILGVLMSGVILLPSITYILEETYRPEMNFDAWIVNIGSLELKLFQPEIYIRYLAKIVTETKPIAFYGFKDDYGLEHISLYITIIGFVYMCNIFFMKDRVSRVYKVAFLIALIFMIFPLFSYVFSGTMDKPYTRWINLLPMIQVMALAHVFDNYGFEKVKMKNQTIIITLMLALVVFLFVYYTKKLNIDVRYAGRDTMTADKILIGVSALYLLVLLIFGWLKKYTVIKWFIWIEVIIAIGYVYSGPYSIRNKLDTFKTMHSINEFLEDNLEKDEFYRVYVDLSRFDVERTNFNRMTVFATNTNIFHSWTDSETNAISKMLFNSNEYQSKDKMNYFGYYINHFLGYKYILVSSEDDFVLDEEYFTFIATEEKFSLYEMNYASSFRVFDSYYYASDNDSIYGNSLNDLSSALVRQKAFLMSAIIDPDKVYDMSQYDLDYLDDPDIRTSTSLSPYDKIDSSLIEYVEGITDPTERIFYVYDEETLDVDFTAGAMYLKFDNISRKISELGEVYMEFSDGTSQSCQIYNLGPNEDESKAPFHIKCEFWKRPVKIYLEDTDSFTAAPTLRLRSERAIDFAAYLVYDLSELNLPSEEGLILFDMSIEKGFEKVFVVDEFGDSYQCLNGYYYYKTKPDKIYIYKTASMYSHYDLYNLRLRYFIEEDIEVDKMLIQDHITNQHIQIKNSKINVSYENVSASENDQIVVIPVAYSDDWQFTSDINYDKISVSGGFLGIVVPAGAQNVDLELKFVPKYLDLGLYLSMGATAVYLAIFILPVLVKKRNRG